MYEKSISKNEFYAVFSSDEDSLKADVDFYLKHLAPASTILDVGAGDGSISCSLGERGASVVALEPDGGLRTIFQLRLKTSKEAKKNVDILPFSLADWRSSEAFDNVLCLHVLPHVGGVEKARGFLKSLSSKISDTGTLLLSCPLQSDLRKPIDEVLICNRKIGSITYSKYSKLDQIEYNRWLTTWRFIAERAGNVISEFIDPIEFTTFELDQLDTLFSELGLEIKSRYSAPNIAVSLSSKIKTVWLVLKKS